MKLFKQLRKFILVVGMGSVSMGAYAIEGNAGLDLSLSNDAGNLGLYSLRETPHELTNLGADFLFNSKSDRFLDVYGSLARKGLLGNKNLELGLKGKLFYIDEDKNNLNGYGLMIGGLGRYWLPTEIPTAFAMEYLYAPSIVTSGDADTASEFNARVEMRILPSAVGYVGYRRLNVEFNKSNYDVDDSFHLGVRVAFQ